jgi:hypothetical protein
VPGHGHEQDTVGPGRGRVHHLVELELARGLVAYDVQRGAGFAARATFSDPAPQRPPRGLSGLIKRLRTADWQAVEKPKAILSRLWALRSHREDTGHGTL